MQCSGSESPSDTIVRTVFRYSLDVLSNGLECTSTEHSATLFLSIWKTKDKASPQLIARYGLHGVGSCDGLARIAADQQYKLGPIRALFLNSHLSDRIGRHEMLSSIPSLLFANQQATISFVVPNTAVEQALEPLVQLVHGHQAYPRVAICAVPALPSETCTHLHWWKVYEDDQILVHAGRSDRLVAAERTLVYLFTFRPLWTTTSIPDSTLLFPTLDTFRSLRTSSSSHWQLPVIEVGGQEPRVPILGRTWVLTASDEMAAAALLEDGSSSVVHPQWNASLFLVSPSPGAVSTIDPGLLVRAQQQTSEWRRHCCDTLLPYFPFLLPDEEKINGNATVNDIDRMVPNDTEHDQIVLQTGTSIFVDIVQRRARNNDNFHYSVRVVDRNRQRMYRESLLNTHKSENTAMVSKRINWASFLREFLLRKHPASSVASLPTPVADFDRDEDEIDLEDYGECFDPPERQERASVDLAAAPHLLVLGTGCASPSPYRGASGYALLIPSCPVNGLRSSLVIAVEVGEGYCTQWHRHAGGRSFATIQIIWISHAHWDHYGGLVNLILRIHQAKLSVPNPDGDTEKQQGKRQKRSDGGSGSDPPILVAPAKVIRFLRLIFDTPEVYYRIVHPEDASMMKNTVEHLTINSTSPILHWRNVRVDHSCLAYGFILVLQHGIDTKPYVFCFSGDTRPSRVFVEQCRAVARLYKANGRVDFLLHEATFDECESQMSVSKKHSTTKEAMMVGRDIDTERLLLTHFSQRYDTIPNITEESERFHRRMSVGFALDGMEVVL